MKESIRKTPFTSTTDQILFFENYNSLVLSQTVSSAFTKGTPVKFTRYDVKVGKTFQRPVITVNAKGVPVSEQHSFETKRVEEFFCAEMGGDAIVVVQSDAVAERDLAEALNLTACNTLKVIIIDDVFQYFVKPADITVKEAEPALYADNVDVLTSVSSLYNYTYYEGQLDFCARVGIKDCALVNGEVGTGKTLMALSLIQLKRADKTLIVAPKGTMKSDKGAESQWVSEIKRFSPHLPSFTIFSYRDYENIKKQHGGKLPSGIYLSYYEALFYQSANEKYRNVFERELRGTDKEVEEAIDKIYKCFQERNIQKVSTSYINNIGRRIGNIKCVINPSLATAIGHEFDMVCLDEAHKICNYESIISDACMSLRPQYRYAFTATPINNKVDDLHGILKWMLPDNDVHMFRGGLANVGYFASRYLTKEINRTKSTRNKLRGIKSKVSRTTALLSRPLEIASFVRPCIAHVSKETCSATYVPPTIKEIKVPMGAMQGALYADIMQHPSQHRIAMVSASLVNTKLWGVCVDPQGTYDSTPNRHCDRPASSLTPKVIATFNLLWKMIYNKEQCVIINSRTAASDVIQEQLEKCGISYSRIDGTTKDHAKQADDFKKKKTQVMLMGIKCAAGYSFDQCPNLIISSLEYTYGSFDQAKGRVDRVTSKGSNIFCIVCKASIEEIMLSTIYQKGDSANRVLKGEVKKSDVQEVNADEVLSKALLSLGDLEVQDEKEVASQWNNLVAKFNYLLTNANK